MKSQAWGYGGKGTLEADSSGLNPPLAPVSKLLKSLILVLRICKMGVVLRHRAVGRMNSGNLGTASDLRSVFGKESFSFSTLVLCPADLWDT